MALKLDQSISSLLRDRSKKAPKAVALAAPGGSPATYADLHSQLQTTVLALNRFGVGRGDAVGIVLPNGPRAAAAFLSIAGGAVAAPLNPAYRGEEFEFYLSDLKAKALVVEVGSDSPALEAAARLGLPVLELIPSSDGAAGKFPPRHPGFSEADDVALALHTSGTTARPKIVPLTHANLRASGAAIARTLALTPADRCLNVMPLFHIHGLIGALLSSLTAGAEVVCSPGFNAMKFFGWLDEFRPTWYTAVPTMHQAILSRAERNREVIERARLRLIRSSSAALPPSVLAELEAVFHCPVIESYGMTEAAHQMASNPLPPAPRKPGSVGPAAGPEVGIMDDGGRLLGPNEIGEVVIRGENVTPGYLDNPEANRAAFTDGWFRTGDQGRLDEEGYLYLTGRLKEIINRGGEKISPREIDEILMEHPAVDQAVTFALPHEKLGEEPAAAVVLREGLTTTERELREFASRKLADFKTPRKIIFLEEIPKGPTGKLQRIGLAKTLGLD